jgi:hypothetical protein
MRTFPVAKHGAALMNNEATGELYGLIAAHTLHQISIAFAISLEPTQAVHGEPVSQSHHRQGSSLLFVCLSSRLIHSQSHVPQRYKSHHSTVSSS